MTPQLVSKECAAHYPALFNVISNLVVSRSIRKFPLTLALISFTQEFESWVIDFVKAFAKALDLQHPIRLRSTLYGEDKNIETYLEFLLDYFESFSSLHPDLGACFLIDLELWHRAILLRTTSTMTYLARTRCPMCSRYSVMKIASAGLCFNNDCQHLWDRKSLKTL
jgi:hypothetical protein